MKDSLIIVTIPSVTIRELFIAFLSDFGNTPAKNAAAISYQQISYLPAKTEPDILLVSQRELRPAIIERLQCLVSNRKHLYIAYHGSLDELEHSIVDAIKPERESIVFKAFSRTETDPFYNAFKTLADHFQKGDVSGNYSQTLCDLVKYFNVDWALESKLQGLHRSFLPSQTFGITKDTLVLWNPDVYAEALKKQAGNAHVATSHEELGAKLKTMKNLLILAELTWSYEKFTQFYGYELAKELIARKVDKDIAFISFLEHNLLKQAIPTARLLAPIFRHYQLPFEGEISFPTFTATKWNIIRHYYLKPDGIVDKLLHDLKKLNSQSSTAKIIATLEIIQTYASILPKPAIDAASRAQKLFHVRSENAFFELKNLQDLLEKYYKAVVSPSHAQAVRGPYKIMVVEDDRDTLCALENGLRDYFETVVCYTHGVTALKELQKNSRSYSALIVDMELLDNAGNWQPVQGYDLIEKAKDFPHLVIYMLTVYSRRALANIQSTMRSGKICYLPKDPVRGLPSDLSYSAFSEQLQNQIGANSKYLVGPQNGVWRKGLLHFYHKTIASAEGAGLWDDVYSCVDEFLAKEEQNEPEVVPKTLFHNDTKNFTMYHLRTSLIHRLICLYRQYREHEIHFEKGIKKSIGFQKSMAKQYFNTLLGFSAINVRKNGDGDIWKIQKKDLFEQEISWLKQQLPEDETVQYPQLVQAVLDASESIPPVSRHQYQTYPKSVESLEDCKTILAFIATLSRFVQEEVEVDLRYYLENYQEEFSQLQEDVNGKEIVKHIRKLVAK